MFLINKSSELSYAQMKRLSILVAIITVFSLNMTGCGYNKLQEQDVAVESSWSKVVSQYQRRADLVPNLVEVTKKYASHEKELLTQVTQARSQVSGMKVTPEVLNDPDALKKYQQAQAQMGGALSRLMSVSENYPQLKSDALFLDLQAQLEGTENRIAVARGRYIDNVGAFNMTARKFPTNITATVFGMKTKANFSVDNEAEISVSPKIDMSDTK